MAIQYTNLKRGQLSTEDINTKLNDLKSQINNELGNVVPVIDGEPIVVIQGSPLTPGNTVADWVAENPLVEGEFAILYYTANYLYLVYNDFMGVGATQINNKYTIKPQKLGWYISQEFNAINSSLVYDQFIISSEYPGFTQPFFNFLNSHIGRVSFSLGHNGGRALKSNKDMVITIKANYTLGETPTSTTLLTKTITSGKILSFIDDVNTVLENLTVAPWLTAAVIVVEISNVDESDIATNTYTSHEGLVADITQIVGEIGIETSGAPLSQS